MLYAVCGAAYTGFGTWPCVVMKEISGDTVEVCFLDKDVIEKTIKCPVTSLCTLEKLKPPKTKNKRRWQQSLEGAKVGNFPHVSLPNMILDAGRSLKL